MSFINFGRKRRSMPYYCFLYFYSALIIVNLVDNSADEEEISTEQQLEELNYALTDIDKNTEEYQDLQLQVDILEYKLDHNIEESILYDFEILTSGAYSILFSPLLLFLFPMILLLQNFMIVPLSRR